MNFSWTLTLLPNDAWTWNNSWIKKVILIRQTYRWFSARPQYLHCLYTGDIPVCTSHRYHLHIIYPKKYAHVLLGVLLWSGHGRFHQYPPWLFYKSCANEAPWSIWLIESHDSLWAGNITPVNQNRAKPCTYTARRVVCDHLLLHNIFK